VLGLYGEDDARVNATVGPAAARMKELGKTFIAHTYPGAGHGFLRAQDGRDGANLAASRKAWPATIEHLKSTWSRISLELSSCSEPLFPIN